MKKEQKIDKSINFDDFSSSYEDTILKSFGKRSKTITI